MSLCSFCLERVLFGKGNIMSMSCFNCGKKLETPEIVKFVSGYGACIFCRDCGDVKKVEAVVPRYIPCRTLRQQRVFDLVRVLN